MGETTKAFLALFIVASIFAGALAWGHDRPDLIVWYWRIGSIVVGLASLVFLLKLHFRSDVCPDYLRHATGNYFNRDGFCFAIVPSKQQQVAYLEVYFQNQYDRRCVGEVALRPAREFFLNRAAIETIYFRIECAPGEFGCAMMALAIPQKRQGKSQSFEVGAAVHYPEGKGRRLRFYDGVFLRTNTDFVDGVSNTLAIGQLLTGSIVLRSPASTKLVLPDDVCEELAEPPTSQSTSFWKPGDAPLTSLHFHR